MTTNAVSGVESEKLIHGAYYFARWPEFFATGIDYMVRAVTGPRDQIRPTLVEGAKKTALRLFGTVDDPNLHTALAFNFGGKSFSVAGVTHSTLGSSSVSTALKGAPGISASAS